MLNFAYPAPESAERWAIAPQANLLRLCASSGMLTASINIYNKLKDILNCTVIMTIS